MHFLTHHPLVPTGADVFGQRGHALLAGQGGLRHLGPRVRLHHRIVQIDGVHHFHRCFDLAGGRPLATGGGLQLLGDCLPRLALGADVQPDRTDLLGDLSSTNELLGPLAGEVPNALGVVA